MDQNNSFEERDYVSEEAIARKNRKNNIVAFIVCTLLAFTLWLMIRNTDADQDKEPPVQGDQIVEQK